MNLFLYFVIYFFLFFKIEKPTPAAAITTTPLPPIIQGTIEGDVEGSMYSFIDG